MSVPWTVINHDNFEAEFDALPVTVQDALLASTALLETYGPALGRPHVDTLAGSKHANMKELRFRAGGEAWRVAFAFDPARRAIVLVAGDKAGVASTRFDAVCSARQMRGSRGIFSKRGRIEMGRTRSEIMATLPEARRAAIEAHVTDLHAEVEGLKALRLLAQRSQEEIARGLGIKQPSVLKIERQTDLYLSTLRRFVEAAGGTLELRVELPGTGVLRLTGMGEVPS